MYRYAYNGGDLTSTLINPCLSYKNTVLTVESPCDILLAQPDETLETELAQILLALTTS